LPVPVEAAAVSPPAQGEVSLFDLINAVTSILKRVAQREDLRDIFEDKWTVSEKIEDLLKATRERSELRFSELFASATSRTEVVVTFLALLELIRLRRLQAMQPEAFGDIVIYRTPQVSSPESVAASVEEVAPVSAPPSN
jgi:segregation and condensation protein A